MRLKSLWGQGLLAVVAQILSALLGAIALWLASFMVDADGFGRFVFALAVATPILLLTDAGMNAAYQRQSAVKSSPALLAALLWARLSIAVLLIGILGFSLLIPSIRAMIFMGTHGTLLALVIAASLLSVVRTCFEWSWQAQRRVLTVETLRLAEALAFVLALLFAPFILSGNPIWWIAWSYLGSRAAGLVATLACAVRLRFIPTPTPARDVALLMREAAPAVPMFVSNAAIASVDVLVLSALATRAEVGLYGLASRIATICAIMGIALTSVLFPRFAALHAQGARPAMDALVLGAHRFLLFGAVPLALILGLFARPFIELFFDASFAEAATSLRWLSFHVLFSAFAHPYSARFMGEGRFGVLGLVTALHLIVLVGFLAWLAPSGAEGAAMAVAFASPVGPVVMAFVAYREGWKVGFHRHLGHARTLLIMVIAFAGVRLLPGPPLLHVALVLTMAIAFYAFAWRRSRPHLGPA